MIPELVDCEPYKERLLHRACVAFHVAANDPETPANLIKDKCRNCPVGSVRKVEAKQRARGDDRVTTAAAARTARARSEARERSAKHIEEARDRAGVATISTHRRADIEVVIRTSRPPAIAAPRATVAESMARVIAAAPVKKLMQTEASNATEKVMKKTCSKCGAKKLRLDHTDAGDMCRSCAHAYKNGAASPGVQTSTKKRIGGGYGCAS